MSAIASALPSKRGERLFAELATSAQDIREAQSLRFRVFGEEMGATLKGSEHGIDVDEFDSVCQHLVVREAYGDRVVGCTRILTDTQARQIGRFYSESEFDLGPVLNLPGRLLEIGRTCIAPEYRQGAAIAVLWSGLAGFIHLHGFDYLFGCASIPLGADDLQAAAIMNRIRRAALAGPEIRVVPRVPLLTAQVPDDVLDAPLPSLLKAYIRAGAKVCGEPCRDLDFGVADVLMLLNVAELNPAYSRHFIERAAGT
jgi:putative hemolysin